jgi:uncharacterized protein YdhG (YjbR/CyaY superfamily)
MPNSVDEYLDCQPQLAKEALGRVRATIRKAVPQAEESISYNIPTYKLHGAPLLYFAAWKKYYSLYPITANLLTAFRKELEPYFVPKSTVRFPLSEAVPVKLIAALAKSRAREIAAKQKTSLA